MDLDKLTNEEEKILATGKLLAYCDDRIIIEPPCYAEIILDSKVIISIGRYRKCREALYFKEFEIQCFCVSIGDSRSMRKIVI